MFKKIIAIVLTLIMTLSFTTAAFASDGGGDDIYLQAILGLYKKIPALMYHKVTDNPAEVTDYVVTGEMLAADFEEINLRGYTPITVHEYYAMAKLANETHIRGNYEKLGEFFKANPKPIIITFDDGYEGIYTHVLPLMQKYGFKVNFYICGELIDSQHPEYCTWEEIKALHDSGYAEIGNHTYGMHSLSKAEINTKYHMHYDDALADINKNNEVITSHTGMAPATYSFPYGQYDQITLQKLRMAGYKYFVSTDYRVNRLKDKQPALGRFNRSGLISTKDYFDMVDNMCK